MEDQDRRELHYRVRSLVQEAWDFYETEPERGMAMLKDARSIAQRLDAPCLLLLCDYWICNTLIFYLRKSAEALDIAVRAAVEAHKPEYARCMYHERENVFRVLVDSYLSYDPVGYADDIRQTIDHIENNLQPSLDDWRILQCDRTALALALDAFDEALVAGLSYLERCGDNDFRLADSYAMLCAVTYYREEWDALLEYAVLGEVHARRASNGKRLSLVCLSWQALAGRKTGDEELAQRTYRQALLEVSRLGAEPSFGYYEALSGYYEMGGQLDNALQLRDRQLEQAIASGSPHKETECRLLHCRLLKKMGRPIAHEIADAEAAATRLLRPEQFLTKLNAIRPAD